MQEGRESPGNWVAPPIPESHILAIPIPPREVPAPRDYSAFFRKLAEKMRRSVKPESRDDLSQVRRKEFVQSFCIALIINLMIVGALLLVVIAPPSGVDPMALSVSVEAESESAESESDNPSAALAATVSSSDTKESASNLDRSSFQSFALSPTDFETPMPEPTDSMLSLGQSLNMSDFAAIESASRREAREFVYGNGSHHAGGQGNGVGVSQAVLAGLFQKSKLGDGSGTAVFVDMSGSMQEISRAVDRYIDEHFKNGVTQHVLGCALKGADDTFVAAFSSVAGRDKRTEYFFVCDLQDGETEGGVRCIRRALTSGSNPKRLHVISFDEAPGFHLAKLLEVTNGTFTYIDPTLRGDSEE